MMSEAEPTTKFNHEASFDRRDHQKLREGGEENLTNVGRKRKTAERST
jgi:hypothetical protein